MNLDEAWTWVARDGWSACADVGAIAAHRPAQVLGLGTVGVRLLPAMPIAGEDFDDAPEDDEPGLVEHGRPPEPSPPRPCSLGVMMFDWAVGIATEMLTHHFEEIGRDA